MLDIHSIIVDELCQVRSINEHWTWRMKESTFMSDFRIGLNIQISQDFNCKPIYYAGSCYVYDGFVDIRTIFGAKYTLFSNMTFYYSDPNFPSNLIYQLSACLACLDGIKV